MQKFILGVMDCWVLFPKHDVFNTTTTPHSSANTTEEGQYEYESQRVGRRDVGCCLLDTQVAIAIMNSVAVVTY